MLISDRKLTFGLLSTEPVTQKVLMSTTFVVMTLKKKVRGQKLDPSCNWVWSEVRALELRIRGSIIGRQWTKYWTWEPIVDEDEDNCSYQLELVSEQSVQLFFYAYFTIPWTRILIPFMNIVKVQPGCANSCLNRLIIIIVIIITYSSIYSSPIKKISKVVGLAECFDVSNQAL